MSKDLDKQAEGADLIDFDAAEIVEDTVQQLEPEEEKMNPTNPGWTQYVLSEMQPDERVNNAPTTDGLRRVTERLLGRIISSKTIVLDCPRVENERRATVQVSLCISCYDETMGGLIEVDGTADVYWGNTDKPFRNYPVATAETRAEGRALRRALRLTKVLVAEEISGNVADHDYEEAPRSEGCITEVQERFIDVMCKRLDIDLRKAVELLFPTVDGVRNLKFSDFEKLQSQLTDYQRDTASIPGDIKGYDSAWRSKNSVPF
jgi:hypothetical protein